ncbi:hypothetical protein [Cellulophaga sp. L1A9]|uniref:hypothetical protein n=1 Tax=Cellulophaga sp. L1A9 TaxID=2686362 RepID=UPI00131C048D|nr:hypothetical protein [Cellulophaga sp. L1A9]
MKKIFTLLLICACNIHIGFAQASKSDVINFIQTELNTGDHIFKMMTNQKNPRQYAEPLLVDENGKILDSKFNMDQKEDEPILEFKSAGAIKLKIESKDSLFIIRPMENSYCPLIKIDLKSTTVFINDYILKDVKEVSVKNTTNVFESEWNGYQWWSDVSGKSSKVKPKLTIGRIKENNKLYIEILWVENDKKMHYRLLE